MLLFAVDVIFYEILNAAVIAFFALWRKKASGKLSLCPVIGYTFAAYSLAWTSGCGTGAAGQVRFSFAIHIYIIA